MTRRALASASRRRPHWPILTSASAVAAVAAVIADLGPPIQPLLVFWFVLACPGLAFVRLFELTPRLFEWVVAVAVSIALGVIVAQLLLYTGNWRPMTGLLILAALTVAGSALQLMTRQESRPTGRNAERT